MNVETWQIVLGMGVTAFGAIGGKELLAKWTDRKSDKSNARDAKSQEIETYWKQQHEHLSLQYKVSEQKIKKLELELIQIRVAADMTFDLLIKIDPDNEAILTKLKEKINGKLEG